MREEIGIQNYFRMGKPKKAKLTKPKRPKGVQKPAKPKMRVITDGVPMDKAKSIMAKIGIMQRRRGLKK